MNNVDDKVRFRNLVLRAMAMDGLLPYRLNYFYKHASHVSWNSWYLDLDCVYCSNPASPLWFRLTGLNHWPVAVNVSLFVNLGLYGNLVNRDNLAVVQKRAVDQMNKLGCHHFDLLTETDPWYESDALILLLENPQAT